MKRCLWAVFICLLLSGCARPKAKIYVPPDARHLQPLSARAITDHVLVLPTPPNIAAPKQLPPVALIEGRPFYFFEGMYYYRWEEKWFYTNSKKGPWFELSEDRYPPNAPK